MKTTFTYILSSLLFFSLASCERDNDILPVEEVVPLRVGNEWVYEVKDYDTNGNLITTSSLKNRVQKDTIIQNSTWYILSDGQIVRNSHEGYVYYNKTAREAVTIYQRHNYGGIGYMYKYHDYDLLVMTTRSLQQDTVTAASEKYASYVFRIENQYKSQFDGATHTIKQEDYVAPGIGLVRADKHYVNSEKVMQRYELVRYTVK
ncbi:hypothetical protein GCM10027443_34670 [Pontibacter brevis]